MTITQVIVHPDTPARKELAVMKVVARYDRMRRRYRVNVWDAVYGRQLQSMFGLPFVPIGKVTDEESGGRRWLKMQNGVAKEVKWP